MWTTLTLIAALGPLPGQNGSLDLNNVRPTYGFLGAPRPDSKLLPGDAYYVAFDIDNVQMDPNGRVLYSMAMEVLDSKKKTQFKQDPRDLEALNSLGGRHLPAFASVVIGVDQPPGEYTLKVTVTDRAAKVTKSFERKFDVQARDFGLVRVALSGDPQNSVPASTIGVAGQSLWLHFFGVGFARGGNKNEPDIGVEMVILDESDRQTLPKPFAGDLKEWPKDQPAVPFDFPLALNRAGKFTIRLKATDRIAKKTAEMSFPITVVEGK
jgi:hypothetical protein